MSEKYRFPFEEAARNGGPIPDDLDLVDMRAYFILKMIYREYSNQNITRKEAAIERTKLVIAYLADREKEDRRNDELRRDHQG